MKNLIMIMLFFFSSNLFSLDFTIPFVPKSIKAADLDLDGDNDLVIGHSNNASSIGHVTICENDGSGSFSILYDFDLLNGTHILTVSNLDSTPLLDIVTSNRVEEGGELRLCFIFNLDFDNLNFLNLGLTGVMVKNGASGDFDNDGNIDLAFTTTNPSSGGSYWGVVYGYGNQTFSQPYVDITPNEAILYEIESKDFNNDNLDDLVALGSTSYLFYSNIDGFDLEVLVNGYNNASMNSDDMDNDGDDDIIISKLVGMTALNLFKYENIEYEYFSEEIQFLIHPWGNHYAADLNGDSLPDLISFGHDQYTVYWNLGEMDFADAIEYPMIDYNEYSLEAAFADFDGNETIDMALIRYGIYENNLSILFNDGNGIMQPEPYVGTSQQETNGSNLILTNYPNPFSTSTTFRYEIPEREYFNTIEIYNIKGEIVKTITLLSSNKTNAIKWNCTNDSGDLIPSGIYFYKLKGLRDKNSFDKLIYLK